MAIKNPKYLAWVRTQPCCYCGNPNSEPHHVIGMGSGIMGSKADDIHTIPLCREHHDMIHNTSTTIDWDPVRFQCFRVLSTQTKAQEEGIL